jgi:hypothetical protein
MLVEPAVSLRIVMQHRGQLGLRLVVIIALFIFVPARVGTVALVVSVRRAEGPLGLAV